MSSLEAAAGGIPVTAFDGLEAPWLGQYFHPAYMAMPGPDGAQVMRIALRAPLRMSPETTVVYRELRGPDVAGAEVYDAEPMTVADLPSNFLLLPPHEHAGTSWPNGRALRARPQLTGTDGLGTSFRTFLQAQGVGPAIYVDGSWLLLSHISQIVNVVPSDSARGWALLIADPAGTVDALEALQTAGNGSVELFEGRQTSMGASASVTIDEVLSDVDFMVSNADAAARITAIRTTIMEATGLEAADFRSAPALFREDAGALVAYFPSVVAGYVVSDDTYLTLDPEGPTIDGSDRFRTELESAISGSGLNASYADGWALHQLLGDVTNGVNLHRQLPTSPAW